MLKFQASRQLNRFMSSFKLLRDEDRIFTNLYGRHDWHLPAAMRRGDWWKTKDILEKGSDWIISQIETAELLGRGGAGYPFAKKLKIMLKAEPPVYISVNCAEGEPGTCKDREIVRHEPHKLVESVLLMGRAICAKAAVVYMRAEFYNEACNLQTAIAEAYAAGFLGPNACNSGYDFDVFIQRGAGNYICGEETALINCAMGKAGRPHRKPPYPSDKGIYDRPTLVVNTETISVTSTICRRGGKWYRSLGSQPHSSGTKLFNISGHVEKPCTVEEKLGIPLRTLLETHCGGVRGGWENLLAIMPGGTSTSLLPAKLCNDLVLDFASLENVKSGLGTGGLIVFDKSTNILKAMERTLQFYKLESCHQCTRCRLSSGWGQEYALRFYTGNAQPSDIDWLCEIAKWNTKENICGFSLGNSSAMFGFIRNFRKEMEQQMRKYADS